MSKWIKCGLPWTFYGDWKDMPSPPLLKNEMKKEFGKTTEQAYKEFDSLLGGARFNTPEYERIVKTKEYKAAERKYKKFSKKVQEWMKTQPAWVAYKTQIEINDKAERQKSFCGKELNKPGTLVEILDNKELKQYLIGDINSLGGVCDDCMGFSKNAVVVRYKVA